MRGGSPGTVNAHAIRLGYEEAFIDAVVFAGGSCYGLSATTGAANAVKELKRKEGDYDHIAGVVGGIIYDVGGRRFSRITPDDEFGRAALRAAQPNRFPMGARGAGRFAMQGSYYIRGTGADPYAAWALHGAFAVLRPRGRMVFSVPHPATDMPFREWARDEAGRKRYLKLDRYFETGQELACDCLQC